MWWRDELDKAVIVLCWTVSVLLVMLGFVAGAIIGALLA